MGLAEKRATKEFQEKKFPDLKKSIDEAAGFNVPIEVDWDSITIEGKSNLYNEAFEKVYFTPLIEGLKQIGADDMGKEALKEGLKNIKLCNLTKIYGEKAITFVDGTLVIDHLPTTNIDDVNDRKRTIIKIIESSL